MAERGCSVSWESVLVAHEDYWFESQQYSNMKVLAEPLLYSIRIQQVYDYTNSEDQIINQRHVCNFTVIFCTVSREVNSKPITLPRTCKPQAFSKHERWSYCCQWAATLLAPSRWTLVPSLLPGPQPKASSTSHRTAGTGRGEQRQQNQHQHQHISLNRGIGCPPPAPLPLPFPFFALAVTLPEQPPPFPWQSFLLHTPPSARNSLLWS